MAKCAYRRERIREIEEKWIDENIGEEKEKHMKKVALEKILILLGEKADCRFDAIHGKEFCIFHDPNYWRDHPDEVRQKFLEHLERDEERFFIGFHLPSIEFPKIVNREMHMDLIKLHDSLSGEKTVFKGKIYFLGATIEKGVNFYGATIKDDAAFTWATFKQITRFNHARFEGLVEFIEAIFDGYAWFNGVSFEEASFKGALFKGYSWFDGAVFKKDAEFFAAKFEKHTWFNGTEFRRNADFGETMFEEGVEFIKATFKGIANFYRATFKERTVFNEAKFLGTTLFNGSTFSENARFEKSVFLPDLLEKCSDPFSRISFRRVNFKNPKEVIFDGCRMSRVSFINTDISRVEFRNIDWGKDFKIFYEKIFLIKTSKGRKAFLRECWRKLERTLDVLDGKKDEEISREIELEPEIYAVLRERTRRPRELEELREKIRKSINDLKERGKQDEIFKKVEGEDDLTLDNVLAVYRGLRDNYDYHLRYEESGRFFINEMRLRRIVGRGYDGEKPHDLGGIKTKLSDIVERVAMWFYEVLALYGESYARPILWAILLIISSSLIRPFWLWMQDPDWRPELGFILEQVKTSTLVFFQLQWDMRTLTIVERLLSIPILGTLVLALRRKLERRVRH